MMLLRFCLTGKACSLCGHGLLVQGCKFEARESLTANTSLSGPLLSRFDVVLLLRDVRQRDVDAAIADHVLGGCMDDGRPCALVSFMSPTPLQNADSLLVRVACLMASCQILENLKGRLLRLAELCLI